MGVPVSVLDDEYARTTLDLKNKITTYFTMVRGGGGWSGRAAAGLVLVAAPHSLFCGHAPYARGSMRCWRCSRATVPRNNFLQ